MNADQLAAGMLRTKDKMAYDILASVTPDWMSSLPDRSRQLEIKVLCTRYRARTKPKSTRSLQAECALYGHVNLYGGRRCMYCNFRIKN